MGMSVRMALDNTKCNKNIFHFFPTPALPVSGSKGLISAIVTATTAPLCYNVFNITSFLKIVKNESDISLKIYAAPAAGDICPSIVKHYAPGDDSGKFDAAFGVLFQGLSVKFIKADLPLLPVAYGNGSAV